MPFTGNPESISLARPPGKAAYLALCIAARLQFGSAAFNGAQ
jgi:hypothetical protein